MTSHDQENEAKMYEFTIDLVWIHSNHLTLLTKKLCFFCYRTMLKVQMEVQRKLQEQIEVILKWKNLVFS